MASTDWKFLGSVGKGVSVTRDWGQFGNPDWTVDNLNAAGGTLAYCNMGGTDGLAGQAGVAFNFGFTTSDVPEGATIDGVEVRMVGCSSSNSNRYNRATDVFLTKTGNTTTVGTSQADQTPFASNDLRDLIHGGATNLWGTTIADTDVRDSNFGIVARFEREEAVGNTGSTGARVDTVEMRVHYTVEGGGGDPDPEGYVVGAATGVDFGLWKTGGTATFEVIERLRDGVAITDSDGEAYVLRQSDVGARLSARIYATEGELVGEGLTAEVEIPATAPSAFGGAQWSTSAGAAVGDIDIIIIIINALPLANGSAITDIEAQLDEGTWVSLMADEPGTYTLSGNDPDTYAVRLRAVNALGEGPESEPKNVTLSSAIQVITDFQINDVEDRFTAKINQACTVRYVILPDDATPTDADRADLYAGTFTGTVSDGEVGTVTSGGGTLTDIVINDGDLTAGVEYLIVMVTSIADSAIASGTFTTNAAPAALSVVTQLPMIAQSAYTFSNLDLSALTPNAPVIITAQRRDRNTERVLDRLTINGNSATVLAHDATSPIRMQASIFLATLPSDVSDVTIVMPISPGVGGVNDYNVITITELNRVPTVRGASADTASGVGVLNADVTTEDGDLVFACGQDDRAETPTLAGVGNQLTASSGLDDYISGYAVATTAETRAISITQPVGDDFMAIAAVSLY